jgi:hypothetical protein
MEVLLLSYSPINFFCRLKYVLSPYHPIFSQRARYKVSRENEALRCNFSFGVRWMDAIIVLGEVWVHQFLPMVCFHLLSSFIVVAELRICL